MIELTDKQLKAILPSASQKNIEKFLPYINEYMPKYGINNCLRVAAFIAQIGHESGSLYYVKEIASGVAYEGRRDLGNTEFGDGARYKGRGLIQITGRTNYRNMSHAIGRDFIELPELLEKPKYAVQSACVFWENKKLNELADKRDFLKITKIINGGYNGLADREGNYNRAKQVLGI